MAVATSFPYAIKVPCSQSHSSSSSFTALLPRRHFVIRSYSQAEGPIRRPMAPMKPVPPSSSPSPPPLKPLAGPPPTTLDDKNAVTLEFQRVKAKELQEYFKKKKLEEASQGPFFGFVGKNEISNGRWAMFGFAVGLLTEYATGSDLVDQVKILFSNFGILDLE